MSRRALTLVAVLALASVVLLVPTGAAPFTQSGTDAISDEVYLEPAEGPHGKYAVLNEDGEIELLLSDANPYTDADGVNENSTSRIDNVFTITYTGPDRAKVWLTDDADDVRFYRSSGAGDSLEREENAVLLGPNATVHVGLRIDTRGDHDVEQASSFTVHAGTPDGPTPTPTATVEPIPTAEPTETPEATDPETETPEQSENGGQEPSAGSRTTATPNRPGENEPGGATPTATTEPTPNRTTDGSTPSAVGGVDGGPATATQRPTRTAGGAAASGSIGGSPTELGGFVQDPGLVLGALLLLLALAYLLRRLAERLQGGEPEAE